MNWVYFASSPVRATIHLFSGKAHFSDEIVLRFSGSTTSFIKLVRHIYFSLWALKSYELHKY